MRFFFKLIIGLLIQLSLVFSKDLMDSVLVNTCDTTLVYHEVLNTKTGRIWLDRNLGAKRVATYASDRKAYGNLYQWGRPSDGHECINWLSDKQGTAQTPSTKELSDTEQPDHNYFIKAPLLPENWLKTPNPLIWTGVDAINNPCPKGFRIPTKNEWDKELESWGTKDTIGAFKSPLKLVLSGSRSAEDGSFISVGKWGQYWSSDFLLGTPANLLVSNISRTAYSGAAFGYCVRCIKDIATQVNELNESSEINIYPNPTKDYLIIESNPKDDYSNIGIEDILGNKYNLKSVGGKIDVRVLRSGVYFLTIRGKNSFKVYKFFKNN